MKKITRSFAFLFSFFILYSITYSQDGGYFSTNTFTEIEKQYPSSKIVDVSVISNLDKQLKTAIEAGNKEEEARLRNEIDKFYNINKTVTNPEDLDYQVFDSQGAFRQPDWFSNDVLVYSGDIGQTGSEHKRIVLKMGEDDNLYAALIVRPQTGANGRMEIYKSENGGANWTVVTAVTSPTAYYGQISMLVETRSPSNMDSTRIFLFYSRSLNSNFNDATITYASVLRDGSGFKTGLVMAPSAGSKLLFPSAISDGQYYTTATYIGVTCGEYSNTDSMKNIRYARTSDWGDTYQTSEINDSYGPWGDWYPVAQFKPGPAQDSVYIAVERRFSNTTIKSKVRVLATTWAPSSGFKRISLGDDDFVYEKPDMAIAQDNMSLPKKIVVAYIKEGVARYGYSTDGGNIWTLHSFLSEDTEQNVSFVALSSDSNATSSDYVIGTYQLGNGDTIVVRRGRPGSLGTRLYKPNQFRSSIYNAPVVAIYNQSGTKSSALLYTGLNNNYTSNLYFDGENLVTDVNSEAGTVSGFSLQQNYPNPFNPSTNIKYTLGSGQFVTLKVYDVIGKEVATLVNEEQPAGSHQVDFNASALSSGVYFYKISTADFTSTKKMILIK